MNRIASDLLERMAAQLDRDDCDEMAIPSYLHPNPVLRWMAWRRVEELARLLAENLSTPSDDRKVVLDFGCGAGVLFAESSQLADRVYGIDRVLGAARLLVAECALDKVVLATPEEAPGVVPEGSVDVILAGEVLEHIEPLDSTLSFLRSRLKPGGVLLVSVPTENALYRFGRRLAGFHGHYHHTNAAVVRKEILDFGFRENRLIKLPMGGPFSIYWVIEFSRP
jgi:2-polyprenyl-3-methyl-5-hydroxy-6-metoxy-1,4-benzoquinol methylase